MPAVREISEIAMVVLLSGVYRNQPVALSALSIGIVSDEKYFRKNIIFFSALPPACFSTPLHIADAASGRVFQPVYS